MFSKKLIVLAGPTAVGKTSVAIQLAEHFRTAVISADSRQIYRELTIGTAKPTAEELAAVPHFFVDSHSIQGDYDAARFGDDALMEINRLFISKKEVILCGGSGLYIKAVCEGFDDIPEVPEAIRNELMANYHREGIGWLQNKMRELDPDGFQDMDQNNTHRLIRALEVRLYSGKPIASFRKNAKRQHGFDIVKIGLELPREELYRRIDERMDEMIAAGLFEEARQLYPLKEHNALQTVGYQEIFEFIENKYDLEECVRLLKRNSRRYAKRQLTWFKKDPDFTWFSPNDIQAIINHIREGE